MDTIKRERCLNALRFMFVGDSLAMPVHWFYSVRDIYDTFPQGITQLEPAPQIHPSSIMNLHSTQRGGRTSAAAQGKFQAEVVGEVILKGKAQFWNRPQTHYHQGMKAGENTLNAHCARVLLRNMKKNHGKYDSSLYLNDYVDFMTSPVPLHLDTYAESYHRAFFANWSQRDGRKLEECAAITHDTPSIGGLVSIGPLALCLFASKMEKQDAQAICRIHLFLTHPDKSLAKVCDDYVELIYALVQLPHEEAIKAMHSMAFKYNISSALLTRRDEDVIGRVFSPACYIDGSWPSVLFLLVKYHTDPKRGLLANANVGGDNCHRGAVLGVLLGLVATTEDQVEPTLQVYRKLVANQEIEKELAAIFTEL